MNQVITPEKLVELLKKRRFKNVDIDELDECVNGWNVTSGTNIIGHYKFNGRVIIRGDKYYIKICIVDIYESICMRDELEPYRIKNHGTGYMVFKCEYRDSLLAEVLYYKEYDKCYFASLDELFEKLDTLEYLDRESPLIKKYVK